MRVTVYRLVLPALLALLCEGALPPYVKPCKRGPGLEACSLVSGNNAIPFIVKGDPKFKIPQLDPLTVDEVAIKRNSKNSGTVNLVVTKLKIVGLKNAKFIKSKMDLAKKHVEWTVETPKITINARYNVTGQFLVLPITGEGPCEIILDKPVFTYVMDYELYDKSGVEMVKIKQAKINHTLQRMRIKLENLFNGNKALGDNMNKALNENWQVVNEQLGPAMAESINRVLTQILTNLSKTVPYNEIVLK